MRYIRTMAVSMLVLTGLAACGQSEQAQRNTAREAMLLGCRNGDASDRAALNQAGVSVDRFCTCAVDRYLQSATAEQIRQLSANPNNAAGLEATAAQCVTEMVGQSAPAAGAPPAGNEAGATPAAPAGPAPAAGESDNAEGNEAGEQ